MNVLKFEVFKINDLKIDDNSNFALLDIDVCRSGDNHNHIYLTKESVQEAAQTLYPNPVLYKCNAWGRDFMGHEEDELIGGTFLNDTKVFEKNGEVWINGKAIIYKRYVPQVMEIFKRKSGKTDVSMEIDVLESYQDENEQTIVTKFGFIGVTLLGVAPAIPEANATVLSFSNAKEVEDAYNAEHFSKYDKLNLSIPKRIKDNVKAVLDRYETEKFKVSSNALGIARYLAREETITVDKARKISDYFKSHGKKEINDEDVVYSLYGGSDGSKWVSGLMEEIKQIDEYKHTTFGKETEEMAEALKVNKSKDAMSESSWGDVDKSTLRKKVTEASNADSIVHDVYMVVEDGWKDAPSEKLKYPVMEVKGNELVYNRGGLSSALGYAKAENDNAVVKKVEAIYKKLDLDEGDEKKMSEEKFDTIQGREAWGDIIRQVHSHLGDHYYVDSVESDKIVVTDTKTKTRYDIGASVKVGKDDKTLTADIHWDTKKKSKVQKGFDRKEDEKDEREVDKETDTKEGKIRKKEDEDLDDDDDDDDDEEMAKKDKKKAKMADDNIYTEPAALLELLKKQSEDYDALAKEYYEDDDKIFASLFAVDEREKEFEEHDMAKMHDDVREVYCDLLTKEMSRFEKATRDRVAKLSRADMESLSTRMARLCKMAKDSTKVLLEENKELKKFKHDIEEKEKMARVKTALDTAKTDLSEDELKEFEKKAEKFSFAKISVWENEVCARAYKNSLKNGSNHYRKDDTGVKSFSVWTNETSSNFAKDETNPW